MDFNPDDFEMKSYRDGNGNLITKEEYERLQEEQAAVPATDGVTDVAFVEIKKEEQKPFFNPVEFLTNALHQAGFSDADAWHKDIDPRAETAEDEKERIFFANRALRLFLAEYEDARDNITPRMLLADGIDSVKWIALMEQGIVPWFLNQFDKNGKRITREEVQEEAPVTPELEVFDGPLNLNNEEEVKLHEFLNAKTGESSIIIGERTFIKVEIEGGEWVCEWFYTSTPNTHYPLVGVGIAENEQWDTTGEMVTQRDELNTEQAVIVGVDAAAEGSSDQTAHMPVKWDVPILKGDQIPDTQKDGHFLQEGRAAGDSGEEH